MSLWDTGRHLLIARGVSVKTYNILHLQFLTMDIVEKMSVDKAPMVEKVTILEDPSSQIDAMCLSDSSNLLAVSASRIFANAWGGTLKVFKSSKDHAFVEAEEVALTGKLRIIDFL